MKPVVRTRVKCHTEFAEGNWFRTCYSVQYQRQGVLGELLAAVGIWFDVKDDDMFGPTTKYYRLPEDACKVATELVGRLHIDGGYSEVVWRHP